MNDQDTLFSRNGGGLVIDVSPIPFTKEKSRAGIEAVRKYVSAMRAANKPVRAIHLFAAQFNAMLIDVAKLRGVQPKEIVGLKYDGLPILCHKA